MSYPGSPIHQYDKLDYEESCHDLDIEETESDNATPETRHAFKRYKGEYGQLKQDTKVWCNGYDGVIVRHYDGPTYEIRVPGGVVATDDFELTDKNFMFQKVVEEQNERTQVVDTINAAVSLAFKRELDREQRAASHLNQLEPNKADPKHIPTSFSEWLEQNNDSIDIGGNWITDRIQANEDQYGF